MSSEPRLQLTVGGTVVGELYHDGTSLILEDNSQNTTINVSDILQTTDTIDADTLDGNTVNDLTSSGGGESSVYTGFLVINSTGNYTISEVPFTPSSVKFEGESVGGNRNTDRDGPGNSNSDGNYAGSFTGFARDDGTRQVIHTGGSGNSINATSHFSSSSACIAIRYADQNGNRVGELLGDITSFDSNGFTVNISSFSQDEVVIYTAYK